jgi:hypothetical protein
MRSPAAQGPAIAFQRALGLFWNVDLALLQPLNQVIRRQVDEFDAVGAVENRIRHGLAHPDMGDLGDDIVKAFDVLDVDRGVDVDSVAEQFLDVEVALRMPAAGRIGMREFVDQCDLRPARNQRIKVHFLQNLVLVAEPFARHDFKPIQQRLGLRPAVGLDDAGHDIGAGLQPGARALQHLIGLADPWGGA